MATGISRTGDEKNNTLIGGDGDDTLIGLAGNDRLEALGGSDFVDAGPGNDWIVISDDGSSDTLIGGDGWDDLEIRIAGATLTLSAPLKAIESLGLSPNGAGSKTVILLDGIFDSSDLSKNINTWNGASFRVDGSAVKSGHTLVFTGNQSNDTFVGGAGSDRIQYQFGSVSFSALQISGSSTLGWTLKNGDEELLKISSANSASSWYIQDLRKTPAKGSNLFGIDSVTGVERLDLYGQESNGSWYLIGFMNLPSSSSGLLSLQGLANRGTDGNDSLVGSAADDQIYGLLGSDTIMGLAGNDNIIVADDGSTDQIDGGDGWDSLTIRVDSGPVVIGGSIRSIEHVNLDPQNATVPRKVTVLDAAFGDGQDRLELNAWGGGVAFEVDGSGLSAGHRLESFNGNSGNDTLRGGAGNDYFWGNQGDDLLVGGAGEDKAGYQFGVAELGKLSVVELGANRWAIRNGSDSLLELNYDSGKAQWTASDARKVIGQNSSAFGTDTLQTIEQVDLHAQDAQARGYFAGYVRLAVNTTGAASVTLGGATNRGTAGNDSILGTASDDRIDGLTGSDTIFGGAGNDNITVADDGTTDQIDGGDGWDDLSLTVNGGSFNFGAGIRNFENIHFNPQVASLSTRIRVVESVFSGVGHHYLSAASRSRARLR
jgi:Ca2+-binding RTX toxin-like protein